VGLGRAAQRRAWPRVQLRRPARNGKTICAEAIAHALDKKLLVVRYSEMESLWAGETGKNVTAVFRAASEQDAVLFFDEADAIAGRPLRQRDAGLSARSEHGRQRAA
jgi:SpoVK/Ycf46/Vps4 family AAA+-type ATPase